MSFFFLPSMRIIIAMSEPQMTSATTMFALHAFLFIISADLALLINSFLARRNFREIACHISICIIIHRGVLQKTFRVIMLRCIEFAKWYIKSKMQRWPECLTLCKNLCKYFQGSFAYLEKSEIIHISFYWDSGNFFKNSLW